MSTRPNKRRIYIKILYSVGLLTIRTPNHSSKRPQKRQKQLRIRSLRQIQLSGLLVECRLEICILR